MIVQVGKTAGQVELKVFAESVESALIDGKALEVIALENGSQVNFDGRGSCEVVLRLKGQA